MIQIKLIGNPQQILQSPKTTFLYSTLVKVGEVGGETKVNKLSFNPLLGGDSYNPGL